MARIDASRLTPVAGQAAPAASQASIEVDVPKLAADALALTNRARAEVAATVEKHEALSGALGWLKDRASEAWAKTWAAGTKALVGAVVAPFETRKVTEDPLDANALILVEGKAVSELAGKEISEARKNLAKDANRERAFLAELDPAVRQAYEQLAAGVGSQPAARRALQVMLLDGRLTEGQAARGGGALLDQLVAMSKQPVVAPIDRKTLVAEVILECENPVRVNQHDRQTCGATTAQIVLLRSNPAEYVRIVSELAREAGQTTLIGGQVVRREADWHTPHDKGEGEWGRTNSSRLFQSAVMEIAGPQFLSLKPLDYDAEEDSHKIGPVPVFTGLFGGGLSRALAQLTGDTYVNHTFKMWDRDGDWAEVKLALREGRGPVPTALTWGSGGHFVQVDRVANGVVAYTNPWGQRETMAEAEFLAHVSQVQIRQG